MKNISRRWTMWRLFFYNASEREIQKD
jgi:hypothetical protein